MLTPNTTGHFVELSRPAGDGPHAHCDGFYAGTYPVIAWRSFDDQAIAPLIVNTEGVMRDATTLDNFAGLFSGITQVSSASGWFAEYGTEGNDARDGVWREPVAAWGISDAGAVGLIAGEPADVVDGKVVSRGNVELEPIIASNFIRYVHASELSDSVDPDASAAEPA